MAHPITTKDLEGVVSRLNKITDSPQTPYSTIAMADGTKKHRANIGNYHLDWAYGGVALHRITNEAGGVTVPIHSGYTTKRDLYNQIHAYINGLLSKIQQ